MSNETNTNKTNDTNKKVVGKPNLFADMAAAQQTRIVDYKDEKGKDTTREITVTEPDIGPTAQIMDLLNVGDDTANFEEVFDRLMNDVLVEPRLSYGQMNDDLPEKYQSKVITKKNKRGEEVKLHMKFPGYRKAIGIFMNGQRPSGASNIAGTLEEMDKEVFRKADGQVVRESYWNAGGDGYGLGLAAIGEAQTFLSDALSYNGNFEVLIKALTFLQSAQLQED